jgi:hypothetical protein
MCSVLFDGRAAAFDGYLSNLRCTVNDDNYFPSITPAVTLMEYISLFYDSCLSWDDNLAVYSLYYESYCKLLLSICPQHTFDWKICDTFDQFSTWCSLKQFRKCYGVRFEKPFVYTQQKQTFKSVAEFVRMRDAYLITLQEIYIISIQLQAYSVSFNHVYKLLIETKKAFSDYRIRSLTKKLKFQANNKVDTFKYELGNQYSSTKRFFHSFALKTNHSDAFAKKYGRFKNCITKLTSLNMELKNYLNVMNAAQLQIDSTYIPWELHTIRFSKQ